MDKNEAIKIIRSNFPTGRKMLCEALEILIPELKESEDEKIKRCIGMCLTDATEQRFEEFNTTLKDCLAWLKKQGEKKSYWSEKDERLLSKLQIYVDIESFDRECNGEDLIAWLKSLRPQPKHEWSEEDEDSLDIAIRIIQNKGDDCAGILDSDKAFKWLKSLKERMKGE